jgi:uncharacterized membrane protein YedE/YeeE
VIKPLIGGALIGLAAVILLLVEGRIAGVSGMLSRSLPSRTTPAIRSSGPMFIAGLIISGFFWHPIPVVGSMWLLAGAGLLVGVGTGLANGCTSGHGVCGIARLSKRSIVATITFMAVAIVTRFLWRY